MKSELTIRLFEKENNRYKHGQYGSRLYETWQTMKKRCSNPNNRQYHLYGGRGIIVCDEWRNDFQAFYDWAMSHGYADDLTIDRIDVNGNYEPSNCRWATMKEQQNNRRNNHLITYNGETKTLKQWSEKIGIDWGVLYSRLKKGWSIEKSLTTKQMRQRIMIPYNGEMKSITEVAKESGIKYATLLYRVNNGWDIDKALNPNYGGRR